MLQRSSQRACELSAPQPMPASPRAGSLLLQSKNFITRLQSTKWASSSTKGMNGDSCITLQSFFDRAHGLAVSGALKEDGSAVRGLANLLSGCASACIDHHLVANQDVTIRV